MKGEWRIAYPLRSVFATDWSLKHAQQGFDRYFVWNAQYWIFIIAAK